MSSILVVNVSMRGILRRAHKPTIGGHFFQALPPEYERIRTSHFEKADFGIAGTYRSNDWGGQGYDDSVPGKVTQITSSGDRTTSSSTWSASLPRVQFISPEGWSRKSPGGAISVPSPPKTGTNL